MCPEEMFDEWEARDPIRRYEERLGAEGIDVEPIRASVEEELERETLGARAADAGSADRPGRRVRGRAILRV
jgi:TPP-dependent pyruvate/acetoin dehydrogenase alpha subunit